MKSNDRDEALRVIGSAGWLQRYPAGLAERLVGEGRLVPLATGEWAQGEGDQRGGLFVVISGLLHSYCAAPGDREVMIGLVTPGSVLGHATRFSGGPRLVTAVCVEPAVLLELTETAIERVAAVHPEVWRAIADFTYANVSRVLRMAAEAICLGPRQRIAARLVAAAEAQGFAGPADMTIRLSQELLGEMTGLTRKSVNGHLSALEHDGIIDALYGRIRVIDLERLKQVVES